MADLLHKLVGRRNLYIPISDKAKELFKKQHYVTDSEGIWYAFGACDPRYFMDQYKLSSKTLKKVDDGPTT
jgi:hypothetical protein